MSRRSRPGGEFKTLRGQILISTSLLLYLINFLSFHTLFMITTLFIIVSNLLAILSFYFQLISIFTSLVLVLPLLSIPFIHVRVFTTSLPLFQCGH